MLIHGELTDAILASSIEVHKALGPGLLESIYEGCLCREMDLRGILYQRQVSWPVEYKGMTFEGGYRPDLVIGGRVVVELKSVERLLPVFESQLMTYLRVTGLKVGLLLNFNAPVLRIVRRVL